MAKMECHTHNTSRPDGGLLAVRDTDRRAYEDYVVLTQAREALERSGRERARLLSRAFGHKAEQYQ